ncbi:MAG TPA: YgiT-type zinc finger protein [Firmicutes bacterium]|nr:YgiT-type zinc finger protein [Bacillota bacterium]
MRREVNLNSMITLKARIAFNGDVEKLINAAVAEYKATLPEDKSACPKCGQQAYQVTTITIPIAKAVVKNVPTWKCSNCGDILYGLRLLADIESVIGDATGEIDFNDLLKPN